MGFTPALGLVVLFLFSLYATPMHPPPFLMSHQLSAQRVAYKRVANMAGWPPLAESAPLPTSPSWSPSVLAGKVVAICTLTESAGRQASEALAEAFPGVRVEVANDLVRTPRLKALASHDHAKASKPSHMVSAWATGQRIVLGQQACDEKSNEITAIPLLLKKLDLKDALVTIDAMGTQTKIAQAIRDGGGDYVPSLKENWPATYAEVAMLFNNPPPGTVFEMHETEDGRNGRIATRRHTVCYDVDWMTSDRRYPGEPTFPGLAMIGRVQTEVERGGKIEYETRYYLCSIRLTADLFGQAVRGHWGIENRLHRVLDVVFREDLARLRSGNAPANMADVRHAALNLLSRAKPIKSFKNRRERAGWNTDYLEAVIRGAA